MACTENWGGLLTLLDGQIPRLKEEQYGRKILKIAMSRIWNKYDWKQSLADLPPFSPVPNQQDYGAPGYTIPADFLGLRTAYLEYVPNSPTQKHELAVKRDLPESNNASFPTSICYNAANSSLRLHPLPGSSLISPDWQVKGTYKKSYIGLNSNSFVNVTIPFDDVYMDKLLSVVQWAAAFVSSQDHRIVEAKWQVAERAIDQMASAEGLNLGNPTIAPSEPLVWDDNTFWY